MPILNSFQHLKSGGIKPGIKYKAQVTYNEDDKRWGRIKFIIPKLFEFSKSDSPWAIPESNATDGASTKSGILNVPAVDSFVLIEFQNGSIYHPVYSPMYINDAVMLEESDTNYPFRKITRYSNGMIIIVDVSTNELIIRNPGVANIWIDGDTNLTVNQGNLAVNVVKGYATVVAKQKVEVTSLEGNINITAKNKGINIYAKEQCNVIAEGGINLVGDDKGDDLAGVVTANFPCWVTGKLHVGSTNVKCTMGGKPVAGISPITSLV